MEKVSRIVELVGLAGAGKSTIARELALCSDQILAEDIPYFRRLRDIPFFAWNTFLFLPTLLQISLAKQGSRGLNGREIIWMVILQGWHRRLKRHLLGNGRVIALDQGPVFYLMVLYHYGPKALKSPCANRWWARIYKQWAGTLDAVIWLDAPNATLVKRIRARTEWHAVKERSNAEALDYLESYREPYENVISLLTTNNDELKVLAFDTSQEALNKVVDEILLEFGLKRSRM